MIGRERNRSVSNVSWISPYLWGVDLAVPGIMVNSWVYEIVFVWCIPTDMLLVKLRFI